ncbi:MAG: hypothetical protein CM15mP2_0620 [Methanobacteriota archaeon]|nr:MAG: hypothetical protein CM15mP2_0620 [Euryarchaeota archaeon]
MEDTDGDPGGDNSMLSSISGEDAKKGWAIKVFGPERNALTARDGVGDNLSFPPIIGEGHQKGLVITVIFFPNDSMAKYDSTAMVANYYDAFLTTKYG